MLSLRKWLCQTSGNPPADIAPAALTKAEAAAAIDLLWDHWRTRQTPVRTAEMKDNLITLGDKQMRLLTRVFGTPPPGGRSLWISLHGGGGAPAQVNDQQWQNQIRLYEPAEGLYIAPRAPTNHWNLWHEGHIDDLFDRLIEDCVLLAGVNPDKVYLMGYSAGGDGVYQLAPRMADRFAAAAMMAGHPGNASPLGLRNLPFAIFAGAEDGAYRRNKVAAEWGAKLDTLAGQNPGAYPHRLNIYPGLGHWMERKDAEAVPWMAKLTRNPWPEKVVLVPIRPVARPLLLARLACRRRQARSNHSSQRRPQRDHHRRTRCHAPHPAPPRPSGRFGPTDSSMAQRQDRLRRQSAPPSRRDPQVTPTALRPTQCRHRAAGGDGIKLIPYYRSCADCREIRTGSPRQIVRHRARRHVRSQPRQLSTSQTPCDALRAPPASSSWQSAATRQDG